MNQGRNRPGQPPQAQQRLSPGVYRNSDGSLGPRQAMPRPTAQPPSQMPQATQGQQPYAMPRPVANPMQGYGPQGMQPPAWAQQGMQQFGPQGMPQQAFNPYQQQQMQQQFAQQQAPQGQANGYWRKTQQPAQPVGIFGGLPPKQGGGY